MSEKEERLPLCDNRHDPQLSLSRSYPGTAAGNAVTPSAPPVGLIDPVAQAAPVAYAGYQDEIHVCMPPYAAPEAPQQQMDPPQVQNITYDNSTSVIKVLILGVVGLIFFWPLAIVALIFALRANNQFSAGRQVEGEKSAKMAKRLAIAAIIIGAVSLVCCIGLSMISSVILIVYLTSKHESDQLMNIIM
jgi:hypothetical protein